MEKKYHKFLIVIDMQNDFLYGSLKVPDGDKVVKAVVEKIDGCDDETLIIVTLDTHSPDYLETKEGKHLPVEHCIKGTSGHEIAPAILTAVERHPHIFWEKKNTGDHRIGEYIETVMDGPEENIRIELVGVCTDICVITNALILGEQFPSTEIYVYEDACQGTSELSHDQAIEVMKKNLINVL